MRHELEHARQLDALGSNVSDVDGSTVDRVLGALGGRPGWRQRLLQLEACRARRECRRRQSGGRVTSDGVAGGYDERDRGYPASMETPETEPQAPPDEKPPPEVPDQPGTSPGEPGEPADPS